MTHGDSPIAGEVDSEWHDRILHASLKVGDKMLMASGGFGMLVDRFGTPWMVNCSQDG